MRTWVMAASIAGVVGFAVGAWMSGPHPHTALAESAAPAAQTAQEAPPPDDGKPRVIFFGAHPDDAEYQGAGVAMKWARMGYHVKLVSVSNGDIGHWQMAGGPLALRRKAEVEAVDKRLGAATEVLDIHDGEIMPTLDNRRTITRLIREWNADIVVTCRPNDYHPDHRYTSILVQDSAYMVGVPFFVPSVPRLKRNPVYLYAPDRFQRPNPFRADVAVAIDDVMDPTLDALLLMESQIQEGGADGNASLYPADAAGRARRTAQCRANLERRYAGLASRYRETLTKFYGAERAAKVKYAQAFEVCEYGRQPSQDELKKMFPF